MRREFPSAMSMNCAYLVWLEVHFDASHSAESHQVLSDRLRTVVAGKSGSFPVLIRHLSLFNQELSSAISLLVCGIFHTIVQGLGSG